MPHVKKLDDCLTAHDGLLYVEGIAATSGSARDWQRG